MSLLQSRTSNRTGRRIVIDLQKAERALKEGHHKEVEQLCGEVLDERPDSFHACQVMAELCLKERRFDDGMAWIQRAREIDPHNPRSLNLLGLVLDHRQDLAGAEAAFRGAAEGDPEYPDALANLGHVLLRTGRAEEAETYFRAAIRHDREHGLANLSLGAILYQQQRPDLAVPHLQTGIQRELTNRPGQYTLAVALHDLGRLDEAITAYRRLIAAGDNDPEVFSRLAAVFEVTGELEMATAGYEAALEIDPCHAAAAAGLAGIMTISGRAVAALDLLQPLLDRGDAPSCVHIAAARTLKSTGRRDEALRGLAELVKRPADEAAHAPAHFLIGDLLELRGEHDRAFAHYQRARRLRGGQYQPEAQERFITRLIGAFTRTAMDTMPRGSASDVPVFIIGMPRSGGSLLEQIIASHPRAAGAGALPHVDLGAGRIGRYNNVGLSYPECMSVLGERDLRELSASYLARLFAEGLSARRVADSMWLNFLHVGLIELMFPNARLVHCHRSPVDAGLGCYFHASGAYGGPFAGGLGEIGHFYGQYRRLMDHWRATTALPMLDIEFEALVRDQEGESRRLIEFLGLPWDPACLSFHENPRVARSSSHEQLRTPLQPSAVGWSRSYERYLQPLRDGLAAAGYPAATPS
jgi:tetratricopeptide (TPR) repeat protein